MLHGHRVKWDAIGPQGPATRVVLVRPEPGKSQRAVLLCESATGLWLHWHGGRSVPCLGEEEGCPLHDGGDNWRLRWKGFLACVQSRTFLPENQLLEVTAEAWQRSSTIRQLSKAGRLRGVEVEVSRSSKGPRGRVGLSVVAEGRVVAYHQELPQCPDVRRLLSILFAGRVRPADPKGESDGQDEKIRSGDVRTSNAEDDAYSEGIT